MKILLVSPFLPYPPVAGGHAQVWAWLRRLARGNQVAFAGCYEREADASGASALADLCVHVRTRLRKPAPHAYSSLAQLPRWVTEFFCRDLAEDIRQLAHEFQPDVVLYLGSNMAQYARYAGRAATAVAALEVASVAHRRLIAAARGWERLPARIEWLRALRYETAVFRRADHVVAMSPHDADIVRAVAPGVRVTPVPPGVDTDHLEPRPRAPVAGRVLYFGHMEHHPNLDGVIFLYQDIWPHVLRRSRSAKLVVAGGGAREQIGRAAPAVLTAMEQDPSVELAGYVPDLWGLMDSAAVMAAPLRLGGGVRNKVIQSLAAGLPVVTTSRGAEGLSVSHERELLLADQPEDFAFQLLRLLEDEQLRSSLTQAGRALVAREHNNDELAKRLERALAQAVGTSATRVSR